MSAGNCSYRRVSLFRRRDGSYQTLTEIEDGAFPYEEDLDTCMELAQSSPFGAQLDSAIQERWTTLVIERRAFLYMIQETELREKMPYHYPLGFRLSCFLHDDFVKNAKAKLQRNEIEPPFTRYLFEEHKKPTGAPPILTREEIGRANAHQGLNVFTLAVHSPDVFDPGRNLRNYVGTTIVAFQDTVSGYLLKSCLHEGYTEEAKQDDLRNDFLMVTEFAPFYSPSVGPRERFWVSCLERKDIPRGSMAEMVAMSYATPTLNLTSLHRETLELAMEGATDAILDEHIERVRGTARKRFEEMYERIRENPPQGLTQLNSRRPLLDYIKTHPQEMRPYIKERVP